MPSHRLRKIAQFLKEANSFTFLYSYGDAEQKFMTMRSAINNNEGLWKNPNILHYLKGESSEGDELSQAVKKHAKSTDVGCVITSIRLNNERFKSKWRVKEDVFIFDEHGVRMQFKVKNKYPETPYAVTNQYGETYGKTQVTKVFNGLELVWERSPETQKKIDTTPNQDLDWFEENKEKVQLILEKLPENQFNQKLLSDLKKKKKIDDTKLDRLYDEAVAQGRSSFSPESQARRQLGIESPVDLKSKSKTTIKITHIGLKEVPSFRGRGTDTKSQIIGISDNFKEKVIVKFGLGTKAGEQLAEALGLPKQTVKIDYVGISTPKAVSAHLGSVPCKVVSRNEKQITIKADPESKHSPQWEEAVKEYESLKNGDKVTVRYDLRYGKNYETIAKELKILKRSGDEFTFDNFIDDVKIPYEDIHDNTDKLIGKKVTVEGEFKLYNGAVFISRPKFTKAN